MGPESASTTTARIGEVVISSSSWATPTRSYHPTAPPASPAPPPPAKAIGCEGSGTGGDMDEDGPILQCGGLRKAFGDLVAVKDVAFSICVGETYGLLGPNGAGKTATISMIAGLLERDAGEVTIEGTTLTTTSIDVKGSIGYVPQDLAIYPDLTGGENLRFFARLYGMRGEETS